MEPLEVTRTKCVALFVDLGFANAAKWSKADMEENIKRLPALVDENTDAGKHQTLMESLIEAVESKTPIHITAKKEQKEMTTSTKPTRKKAAKKKAATAKKPAKKKAAAPKQAAKKKAGNGNPGITAAIAEMVNKASKSKPITRAEILETLISKFPDRSPDQMKHTVGALTTICTKAGIEVGKIKTEGQAKAYYPIKRATAKKPAKKKPAKKKATKK